MCVSVRIRAYPCVSVCGILRILCVSVRIRAYPFAYPCVFGAYPCILHHAGCVSVRILRIRGVSAYRAYPSRIRCVSCVSARIHVRIRAYPFAYPAYPVRIHLRIRAYPLRICAYPVRIRHVFPYGSLHERRRLEGPRDGVRFPCRLGIKLL